MKHLLGSLAVTALSVVALSGCSVAGPVIQASADHLLQNDSLTSSTPEATPQQSDTAPPATAKKGKKTSWQDLRGQGDDNAAKENPECTNYPQEKLPGVSGMPHDIETLELQMPRGEESSLEGRHERLPDVRPKNWRDLPLCGDTPEVLPMTTSRPLE